MKTETFYLHEGRTDVSLTTYLWSRSNELGAESKRPAVLVCPGGGYLNCSDREAEPVALRFAAMGYHAFVLRYSTYMMGRGGFPDLSKPLALQPLTAHPAPVREIGQAMLLIRQHAEEWAVDPDRIAVCGFSAGGHNAAMYATNWHREVVAGYFGVDKELLRPAAAILGYPLTDYVFMDEATEGNDFDRGFFKTSNTAFLGTAHPTREQLTEVSPARLVDENTPPMFLWATSTDELVPVTHSLRMAQALSAHKIPYALHIFEQGKHGLSVGTQASASALSQISDEVADWTRMAEIWLKKWFALQLPALTGFEQMLAEGKLPF